AVGTQVSENGVVLWDDIVADVSHNTFESFGDSGPARADQGGAMVASDYSVGYGIIILASTTPSTTNQDTVTGNTFTDVQGAFIDLRAGTAADSVAIHAPAFLAGNTMTGGYSVPGPLASTGQVLGSRSDDPNYLNYAIAMAANWQGGNPACTPATPEN